MSDQTAPSPAAIRMVNKKTARLERQIARLTEELERTRRLLPEIGKSAAVVTDYEGFAFDEDEGDLSRIITVGDTVYSKYGEEGVVVGFENIDADRWFEVRVIFEDADGKRYNRTADRLN